MSNGDDRQTPSPDDLLEDREERAARLDQDYAADWALLASMGGMVIIFVALVAMEEPDSSFTSVGIFFILSLGGLLSVPIGLTSGWIAHRVCYKSTISTPLMAVALTLIANLTILGWTMLMAHRN